MSELLEHARCRLHPALAAVVACDRCGDFACADCANPLDGKTLCSVCYERGAVLADPSLRLAAYLLNQLIVSVPACFLIGVIIAPPIRGNWLVAIALAVAWGIGVMIGNLRLLRRDGQTLGKRWFGLRILRAEDGARLGLTHTVLLRELAPMLIGLIPLAGVVFVVLNPLFLFGTDRRALHDLIAGTMVVQVPPRRSFW